MRIKLGASDLLSLSFISLLILITLCFSLSSSSSSSLLTTYFGLAFALVALSIYRNRTGRAKRTFYLHTALTVIMILMIFNSLGDLIPTIWHRTFDDVLIRIDRFLFGIDPTIWMERLINPFLTALLQAAYISYYLIPISLGIVLIRRGRFDEFETALFGIVLCFYLSYIGYILVPAIGPRFTLEHLQTAGLQASPFIRKIQETLNGLEHNKTDAFPSGHTAIALTSLYYCWKLKERGLFRILLPVGSAMIFSTVYLRYHYVIDVIAGTGLAALTIALAPVLSRKFSGSATESGNESHYTT